MDIALNLRGARKWIAGATAVAVVAGAGAVLGVIRMEAPEAARLPWYQTAEGVAISGYDTVAYFTVGEPVEGSNEHEYVWQDAVWRFANDEHREMFISEPERYSPQFGGHCALAMTYGQIAKADPDMWAIVDDRLYLNYDAYAREIFHDDLPSNIADAETEWEKKLAEARAVAKIEKRLAEN